MSTFLNRLDALFLRILERTFGFLCYGSWLAAVVVLGLQIILYLKNGAWLSLSVIDGLVHLSGERPSAWLLHPQDWIGLHNLLDKLPLSLGLLLLGVVAFVLLLKTAAEDELRKERLQREKQE